MKNTVPLLLTCLFVTSRKPYKNCFESNQSFRFCKVEYHEQEMKCLDNQMLLLRFSYTFTRSLGSYRVTKHSCYCIDNTEFPVKVTGLLLAMAKE